MNLQALKDCADSLPPGRQSFARSLIEQASGPRGLSAKQAAWVDKLVEIAKNPPHPRAHVAMSSGRLIRPRSGP